MSVQCPFNVRSMSVQCPFNVRSGTEIERRVPAELSAVPRISYSEFEACFQLLEQRTNTDVTRPSGTAAKATLQLTNQPKNRKQTHSLTLSRLGSSSIA